MEDSTSMSVGVQIFQYRKLVWLAGSGRTARLEVVVGRRKRQDGWEVLLPT